MTTQNIHNLDKRRNRECIHKYINTTLCIQFTYFQVFVIYLGKTASTSYRIHNMHVCEVQYYRAMCVFVWECGDLLMSFCKTYYTQLTTGLFIVTCYFPVMVQTYTIGTNTCMDIHPRACACMFFNSHTCTHRCETHRCANPHINYGT